MKKRKRVTNKRRKNGSYPCSPSNDSNSSTLTLFDCPPCVSKEHERYVPMDYLEISLFDKTDTCYAYGYDVPMNETCETDYAIVIYDNPCYFDKSYDNPLFVPTILVPVDHVHDWDT